MSSGIFIFFFPLLLAPASLGTRGLVSTGLFPLSANRLESSPWDSKQILLAGEVEENVGKRVVFLTLFYTDNVRRVLAR